jgi:hypothetical protein
MDWSGGYTARRSHKPPHKNCWKMQIDGLIKRIHRQQGDVISHQELRENTYVQTAVRSNNPFETRYGSPMSLCVPDSWWGVGTHSEGSATILASLWVYRVGAKGSRMREVLWHGMKTARQFVILHREPWARSSGNQLRVQLRDLSVERAQPNQNVSDQFTLTKRRMPSLQGKTEAAVMGGKGGGGTEVAVPQKFNLAWD